MAVLKLGLLNGLNGSRAAVPKREPEFCEVEGAEDSGLLSSCMILSSSSRSPWMEELIPKGIFPQDQYHKRNMLTLLEVARVLSFISSSS